MAVHGSESNRKTKRKSEQSGLPLMESTHLPNISTNLTNNSKKLTSDNRIVFPKIGPGGVTSAGTFGSKRNSETKLRPFQILERKEWHFTESPTPLRLYVSYYVPHYDPFINRYIDDKGEPFVRESQQHLVHGMVLNKEGRSFHPPVPPIGSETRKSRQTFQRKAAKYINIKRSYLTNKDQ